MNKSIYTETLCTLLAAVNNFRAGEISIEKYQAELFKAENEIVSVEERELRSLLLNHENELELIQFTTGINLLWTLRLMNFTMHFVCGFKF